MIQHILHQSTNMYNDDGNDTRVGRKVAVTVMIQSTMKLLMLVCSSDVKTKVFLLKKIVTVLRGNNRDKEEVKDEVLEESNIKKCEYKRCR